MSKVVSTCFSILRLGLAAATKGMKSVPSYFLHNLEKKLYLDLGYCIKLLHVQNPRAHFATDILERPAQHICHHRRGDLEADDAERRRQEDQQVRMRKQRIETEELLGGGRIFY